MMIFQSKRKPKLEVLAILIFFPILGAGKFSGPLALLSIMLG
jgi:hypothetical protein